MSFLKAAKDFFLVAPKIADDVFDNEKGLLVRAGGFINDLNYSDQEKARDYADLCKNVAEFVKETLSESTERSVTRRSIGQMWIKVQLGLILMVAICLPFNVTLAAKYFELATCNVMLWGTLSVIAFFFGAYMIGTHMGNPFKKKE